MTPNDRHINNVDQIRKRMIAYYLIRPTTEKCRWSQNLKDMNVIFEHPTIIFDDKIAEIIIEFVNHILYADNEDNLRRIVTDFAYTYELDSYFVYGFGSHHLWLRQTK